MKGLHCKLIRLALLLCSLWGASSALAQPSHFSIRIAGGVAHLPLSDWSDFIGKIIDGGYYQKNNPNFYPALSVNYALSEKHSLGLGIESIKTTASLSSILTLLDSEGDSTGFAPLLVKWKFRGIPITLGYEYRWLSFNQRFAAVAGIGVSYFISQVKGQEIDLAKILFPVPRPEIKRTGRGYGLHAAISLISQLTDKLHLIFQARYRYSDGMAFSDKKESVKVEFTGFDFSLGIGWSF